MAAPAGQRPVETPAPSGVDGLGGGARVGDAAVGRDDGVEQDEVEGNRGLPVLVGARAVAVDEGPDVERALVVGVQDLLVAVAARVGGQRGLVAATAERRVVPRIADDVPRDWQVRGGRRDLQLDVRLRVADEGEGLIDGEVLRRARHGHLVIDGGREAGVRKGCGDPRRVRGDGGGRLDLGLDLRELDAGDPAPVGERLDTLDAGLDLDVAEGGADAGGLSPHLGGRLLEVGRLVGCLGGGVRARRRAGEVASPSRRGRRRRPP